MDRRRVIGKDGKIPWNLPDDMRHFTRTTLGNAVVMGRKTYDSLPPKFKPLPNRDNFVLSNNNRFVAPRCVVLSSIEPVLEMSLQREVFIIGGTEIYKLFLPCANKVLITQVETVIEQGDTFFPPLLGNWQARVLEVKNPTERNQFGFFITRYIKKVL